MDFERVKHTASDSARKARDRVGTWLGERAPGDQAGGRGEPDGGRDRPGYGTGPEDELRRLRAWLATRPDIAYDPRQLDQPDPRRTTFWRPGVIQVVDTADHAARVTQALRQHAHVSIRSRCHHELDGAPNDLVRFEFDLAGEGRGGPTVFDVIGDVHATTGVEAYPAYVALAGGRLLFAPDGFPSPATAADVAWDTPAPPPANGPVVAVVDTGIDATFARRPRFEDAVDVENARDLDPLHRAGQEIDLRGGHGTFVASIVRQVCPQARVVVERALDTQGVTDDGQLVSHLWRTLHAPIPGGQRVGVVVLALEWEVGSPGRDGPTWLRAPAPFVEQVFDGHPNVVFCCAAGDDGSGTPPWPAASSQHKANVVAVGALGDAARGRGGQPAPFSNHGDWVDAWAPGERVAGIYVRGSYHWSPTVHQFDEPYAFWSGTAFAAAHLAARIAAAMHQGQPTALDAWYAVRDADRPTPAEP